MSTAGKVLVVLVALAIIPWILLFSMVSQLNKNWGRTLQEMSENYEKTQKNVVTTQNDLDQTRREFARVQIAHDQQLVLLRSRLSDAEKRLALIAQHQKQYELVLAALNKEDQDTKRLIAQRQEEKQQTEKALADTRAEVQALSTSVESNLKELQNLRQTFVKTMDDNRAMLKRLHPSGGAPSQPRTRPASLRRAAS